VRWRGLWLTVPCFFWESIVTIEVNAPVHVRRGFQQELGALDRFCIALLWVYGGCVWEEVGGMYRECDLKTVNLKVVWES